MTIVLDTETTGLHPEAGDELLQVSIIGDDGSTIFDSLIHPIFASSWEDAMAVNHITPEMVQDAPYIGDVSDDLRRIIQSADTIIGYNTPFDLGFLDYCAGVIPDVTTKIIDVMADFKQFMQLERWVKLTEAAAYFGFDWSAAPAHNSLGDCLATLHVYKCLQERREADGAELTADRVLKS